MAIGCFNFDISFPLFLLPEKGAQCPVEQLNEKAAHSERPLVVESESKILRKMAQHRPPACTHTHTATHSHVACGSRVGDELVHFLNLSNATGTRGKSQYQNF